MAKKRCPVCGCLSFQERRKEKNRYEITPGLCLNCGFIYEEDMGQSLEEQIIDYRQHLIRKGIEAYRRELYR